MEPVNRAIEQINGQLVDQVLRVLNELGVQEVCVCPAKRNAPFVQALTMDSMASRFKVFYFFEERCAAFFALGRIRTTGRAVAVITTSGTAVGELLPATMEAFYAGFPLILLTADRPRHYRGSGAPQSAEQMGIFSHYVSDAWDWASAEEMLSSCVKLQRRPLHLNVCLDEPLWISEESLESSFFKVSPIRARSMNVSRELSEPDGESRECDSLEIVSKINIFLQNSQFPWVMVGMLPPQARKIVKRFLLKLGAPVYLEGVSGLREDPDLASIRILNVDQVSNRSERAGYRIDGILRIGGVPTPRFWRDLELGLRTLPVLSLSELPFSGLGRESVLIHGPLEMTLLSAMDGISHRLSAICVSAMRSWVQNDQEWDERLKHLFLSEPQSEPALFYALSQRIPKESQIYVGNSLPIREWDLASVREDRQFQVWASRGLNGIDGQISTFLGFVEPTSPKPAWAIFGDLTTLYDLPAPWILPQLESARVNFVVINNGGGKIFSRMFPHPAFQNQHPVEFRAWAELWQLKYEKILNMNHLLDFTENRVIEVLPSEEATQRFWKVYAQL